MSKKVNLRKKALCSTCIQSTLMCVVCMKAFHFSHPIMFPWQWWECDRTIFEKKKKVIPIHW